MPDTDTRGHLSFLDFGLRYDPDIVVLLYVFNDIDYVAPVTSRSVLTEHPNTLGARAHPARVAIVNSFAAQEVYARWRHIRFARRTNDPYGDSAIMASHFRDLVAFGQRAWESGAAWGLVPFDITLGVDPGLEARYDRFVREATAAGLPVWSLRSAFRGESFEDLVLNPLDAHPNKRGHRLAALAVHSQLARLGIPDPEREAGFRKN
jgi:hypothetical protein